MKKFIQIVIASVILTGCPMSGMKPPPDAAFSWDVCDPAIRSNPDLYISKQHNDMFSCRYDPMGGGDIEADACVRKKGWFVVGWDAIPQNKIYETNCPRKEQMLREQQNKKSK